MTTAKSIEDGLNGIQGIKAMMTSSAESQMVRKLFQTRMREYLTDDKIYRPLLPDFAVGCRRLTPGNPFMKAIQKPNVSLHKAAVNQVRGSTVIGDNGDEVEVDTLTCATGFDVGYVPKYRMQGRGGITLQDTSPGIRSWRVVIYHRTLLMTDWRRSSTLSSLRSRRMGGPREGVAWSMRVLARQRSIVRA